MSLNLLSCRHCGTGNFPGNQKCRDCGQPLRDDAERPFAEPERPAVPAEVHQPAAEHRIPAANAPSGHKKAGLTLAWILSIACSGLAFVLYLFGLADATSAPQQAAAAAMAVGLAVIPYCITRAISEIAKLD